MSSDLVLMALDGQPVDASLARLAQEAGLELRVAAPGETFEACRLAVLAGEDISAALERLREPHAFTSLVRYARRGGGVLALGSGFPLLGTEVLWRARGCVIPALKLVNFKVLLAPEPCLAEGWGIAREEQGSSPWRARYVSLGSIAARQPARPWFELQAQDGTRRPEGVVSRDGRVMGTCVVNVLDCGPLRRQVAEQVVSERAVRIGA